jgi:hypothetical protein
VNQPFDAGVICVWGPNCVNLSVTDHAGNIHFRSSVFLRQEEDAVPSAAGPGYAEWMPYQTAQAKK